MHGAPTVSMPPCHVARNEDAIDLQELAGSRVLELRTQCDALKAECREQAAELGDGRGTGIERGERHLADDEPRPTANDGLLHLRGPAQGWEPLRLRGYAGELPFDLFGPQRVYAAAGIGLALIDPRRQREDVVNDRIFEICGAGAVAICPDIPWIRQWFGDSVLYFDPDATQHRIAATIIRYHAFCLAEPEAAEAMAGRARAIVEEHFSADRMIANLLTFHRRRTEERVVRCATMLASPQISGVVRCGGRALALVRRAIDSIRRQSFGRFTVILAKYRDIDLSEIISDQSGAITDFIEFLIPGGGRAQMLFEGVQRVSTEYFAVLDDDDFLLSDHFEDLFRACRLADQRFDIAFSGVIEFDHPTALGGEVISNRNIARFGFSRTIEASVGPWLLRRSCPPAGRIRGTWETKSYPCHRRTEVFALKG